MSRISFIHAADLHLDSPFKGLSDLPEQLFDTVQNSTFQAFDRLVRAAIDYRVDFVLLAGDIFDQESRSLKAQIHLRDGFKILKQHHIDVYLSFGNHDYVTGTKLPVSFPSNVHVFPTEQVRSFIYSKDDKETAAIYGFSYEQRAVTENKTNEYLITRDDIPFHIAMLHGSLQSNTEHDVYAPFLLSELTSKPFDYWALGHIHQRNVLKQEPPVVYPGNVQGRHRNETGEKGCYYVQISEHEAKLSFIPLQSIQFSKLEINGLECVHIFDVENQLNEMIAKLTDDTPYLIDVTLTCNAASAEEWKQDNQLEELIELTNERLIHRHHHWKYIYRLSLSTKKQSIASLEKGDHFIGELARTMECFSVEQNINELYRHRQASRYLESLDMDEIEVVKQEAQEILLHALLKS